MQQADISRAVAAAQAAATACGLEARDAVVLNNSNKLIVLLQPCGVVARIAPPSDLSAFLEVDLAQQLLASGSPVATLEPPDAVRVHERDGFTITLWTYYPPVSSREITPAEYAAALVGLHAGMRTLVLPTPHMTDRVDEALAVLADHDLSPDLPDADRELLSTTLSRLGRRAAATGRDQLLHGEPHPGNVLLTTGGVVFIDLETCCRGPVEFDLAHAPDEIADHYPGADRALLEDCRLLKLAMITSWRADRTDQLPEGRRLGEQWLAELRAGLAAR